MKKLTTGAEKIRWDLSFLYSGIDDPQIDVDVQKLVEMAKNFHASYYDKLSSNLGKAIADFSEIIKLDNKIQIYLGCSSDLNLTDSVIKAKNAEVGRILAKISGDFLEFFELQIMTLSDSDLDELCKKDPVVLKHKPWIKHVRIFKPHSLSEPVESALTKRLLFSQGSWAEFFKEVETGLVFKHKKQEKTLTEMLHIMSDSKKAKERFAVMKIINDGFKGFFSKYSAQTLYMVSGSNAVERQERKYRHPMEVRNKKNCVSDSTVDALHKAVTEVAGPLVKRYYKLKAAHLKLKTLRWSDRNAPMPFADASNISFDEAIKIVVNAYGSFSPTLAQIIKKIISQKWIDAPAMKNKHSGAYNCSAVLPGDKCISLNLLNYLGSNRDVMTLAHELGHAVHGILAGGTQGVLMQQAPIVYAETASVFGEMTVFNFLKKRLVESGDEKSLLALLMGKIDDVLNTAVRQIGFSNFERRLHGMDKDYKVWSEPKKFSAEEINDIWLETVKSLYGEDGEIFTYEDMECLWSYISHFHRPFYVYGYAFGELLTQSLYAVKDNFGEKFEPLYLELLKAGETKDAVELLRPFGLNPSEEKFWSNGIMVGLGSMINEVEKLSRKMGIGF